MLVKTVFCCHRKDCNLTDLALLLKLAKTRYKQAFMYPHTWMSQRAHVM